MVTRKPTPKLSMYIQGDNGSYSPNFESNYHANFHLTAVFFANHSQTFSHHIFTIFSFLLS